MSNKVTNWVERKLALDAEFGKDCREYDNIEAMRWDLPPNFQLQTWMRKRVSTAGRDIIRQACNIFDTYEPKFEILPRGPADADKAEQLECWGEWEMYRASMTGDCEATREILKHSVKYDRVCTQVEYLPAWTKDKDALNDPFLIRVFHPGIVHYDMAGKTLRRVALVDNRRAVDVLEHWEPYVSKSRDGKKIERAVTVLQELVDEDEEARVIYVDYTDRDRRYVFFCEALNETIPSNFSFPAQKDITVIVDNKPDTSFINWVIVRGSTGSILESLHKGGLIENQNFLKTAVDSIAIRKMFPIDFIEEGTGEVLPDYSPDGTGILKVPPTAKVTPNPHQPLDPAMKEILDRNSADINASTGLENLSSMNAANVQAAVVSMIVQLRLMELEPHKRTAEKALAQLLAMMFKWVQERDDEVTALRRHTTKAGPRGQKITLSPEDFDPKHLIITCTLLTKTPTDMQQKVNMFMLLRKEGMPIPDREYVERLKEFGDPDKMRSDWEQEQVEITGLRIWQQQQLLEMQTRLSEFMRSVGMGTPANAPGNANPPANVEQPALETAGGQGNNPATQGQSPYQSLPPQMRQSMLRRP